MIESPFRLLAKEAVKPFVNSVPVLERKVAAGAFSGEQLLGVVRDDQWAAYEGRVKPAPGLFIAQNIGESMNRRTPNGV